MRKTTLSQNLGMTWSRDLPWIFARMSLGSWTVVQSWPFSHDGWEQQSGSAQSAKPSEMEKKICLTRPKKIPTRHIVVVYQSICSCTITDQLLYNRVTEKNLDGEFHINNSSFYLAFPTTHPDFFCNPVVLESICYRTRANQLRNEVNTTGGRKKT